MIVSDFIRDKEAVYAVLEPLGALRDAPLSGYTTFRIGGNADILFSPRKEHELLLAINVAQKNNLPFFIMGAGSNILVADSGFPGLVIRLCMPSETAVAIDSGSNAEAFITFPANMMLSHAAKLTVKHGFSGLEWAYGIPGTVGGAVAMNAGAYGGEIKQRLKRVRIIVGGGVTERDVADEDLSYRQSVYSYPDAIVLSATFKFETDDGSASKRMNHYISQRRAKQPLDAPSAGSVFKRPEGHFAGALIEQAGLKGVSVGGARVSTLHAGFIVNDGNATASDVLNLISIIKDRVFNESGIMLEEELKIIGEV